MSKIDYDLRKIRGVAFDVDGVLSPSTVPMSENGEPMRMVNIKDGYAMQLAVKCGIKIAIITGARTPGIVARYNALGIHDVFLGASDKLPILAQWMSTNGLKREEVAFVGDDIPDLPCLRGVGLPWSCASRRGTSADVRAATAWPAIFSKKSSRPVANGSKMPRPSAGDCNSKIWNVLILTIKYFLPIRLAHRRT